MELLTEKKIREILKLMSIKLNTLLMILVLLFALSIICLLKTAVFLKVKTGLQGINLTALKLNLSRRKEPVSAILLVLPALTVKRFMFILTKI